MLLRLFKIPFTLFAITVFLIRYNEVDTYSSVTSNKS